MFADDKVTEIFLMADELCKFFNTYMEKHNIKDGKNANITVQALFQMRR